MPNKYWVSHKSSIDFKMFYYSNIKLKFKHSDLLIAQFLFTMPFTYKLASSFKLSLCPNGMLSLLSKMDCVKSWWILGEFAITCIGGVIFCGEIVVHEVLGSWSVADIKRIPQTYIDFEGTQMFKMMQNSPHYFMHAKALRTNLKKTSEILF